MALPTCPKGSCTSTTFRATPFNVANVNVNMPLMAVLCTQCGAVVGVLENEPISAKLDALEKKLLTHLG